MTSYKKVEVHAHSLLANYNAKRSVYYACDIEKKYKKLYCRIISC